MSLQPGWELAVHCCVCNSGADPRRKNTLCIKSDDGAVVGCGKSGGAAWNGQPPFSRGKRLWFYRLKESAPNASPLPRIAKPTRGRRLNFDRLFVGWWREARDHADWLADLAADLGVSIDALSRLGIGWAPAARPRDDADPVIIGTRTLCRLPGAWLFPMRNHAGDIVGARVRTGRGSKYAVTTSDGDSIFSPCGLHLRGTLLLPEGPTSTAALLDLGLDAIGRPANFGGAAAILGYASRLRPSRVLVVGDNDERRDETTGRTLWPGSDGARSVAADLTAAGLPAEVVFPPGGVKDSRAWLNAGATPDDVRAAWAIGRTGGGDR